jgi:hypothetical protein
LPSDPISVLAELGSSPSGPSSRPVSIGKEQGVPARGALLFFDPTQMYSCRVCHSYDEKGGPIGPDLAKNSKTPEQIYFSLARARVAAVDYPAITLRLSSGASLAGIKSDETADAYVIFDLSSLPPVKRTVLKSQVAAAAPAVDGGIYDHTALPFGKQDLLDLSAYLGVADTPRAAK